MISDFAKRLGWRFGWVGAAIVAGALLLLLPFTVVALSRLTGWSLLASFGCLIALNLIPFAGQLAYVGLAVMGAFYLGQDNLAERTAAMAVKKPSVATASPAGNFVEWKRTVAAPSIQNECIETARRKGLVEGRQIEQMARVCACYGAPAVNVLMESDVVNDAVQPSPQLDARLSDEARRLCNS